MRPALSLRVSSGLTTTELFSGRFWGRDVPLTHLQHPRSRRLRECVSLEDFLMLVKASDYSDDTHAETARFRAAKELIEVDRDWAAREAGYATLLTKLHPLQASPKHHVLVGLPPGCERVGEWADRMNGPEELPA
jgi:hypothetical protein